MNVENSIRHTLKNPRGGVLVCVCMMLSVLLCTAGLTGCQTEDTGGDSFSGTIITENADGTVTIRINESSQGFVSTTGVIGTNTSYSGYEGQFIENLGEGSNIIYVLNSSIAGDVNVSFRYAFWGSTEEIRAAYIYVNGILANEQSPVYCPWTSKTGNTIWQQTAAVRISLAAGDNYIRVIPVPKGIQLADATFPDSVTDTAAAKAAGSSGKLPNIDYIQCTTVSSGHTLAAGSENTAAYYSVKVTANDRSFGSVVCSPDSESAQTGTEFTVTATPAAGYRFDSWTGTVPSTENPYTFTVGKDITLTARFISETAVQPAELVGFGAVQDDKATPYTLTGGFGGEEITVSGIDELTAALTAAEPKIINVESTITTADDNSITITAASNKTIQSKTGTGHIKNIEIKLNGENYIVRNMIFSEVIAADDEDLNIKGVGNDSLKIGGGAHVWIDHCEFYSNLTPVMNDGTTPYTGSTEAKDFYDGLLDITNGAAFITVSHCYFHDHWKAILCGSGDGASDALHDVNIRVTFHNNYFENIGSRTPLLRYGKAHIFNNYWLANDSRLTSDGNSTSAVNARTNSEIFIEYNKFAGISKAVGFYFFENTGIASGKWHVLGNDYGTADSAYAPASSTTSWKPAYTYTVEQGTGSLAETVPVNAGVGKITVQ